VLAKRIVLGPAVALALTTGCLRKDYPVEAPVVARVDLRGADAVSPKEVLAGLATAESPRFLGIWDGVVFDYEVFDETLLERDLDRIERFYRARGYYETKVTAARVVRTDAHHVKVQIRVHEGLPVLVAGDVQTPGLEGLPFPVAVAASRAVALRPGDRFDEAQFERSKTGIKAALADRGYPFAKVTGRATVDIAREEARVTFEVEPGPPAVYGDVRIVGLREVPERPVRDNLDLAPGKPYSRAEVLDARTALINLGVFATVDVREDLTHPETGTVPVTVTIAEAPLRTLRMGGGMRFDVLEWSSNLSIGWEHRNFLGGLRRFSIDTKPGIVFFPTRMDNLVPPERVLLRNRVRAELLQPAFLEGRTTGIVATEFNIYPVLYPGGQTSNENVIGYDELKIAPGVRRAFFGHHVYATLGYTWQANFPFAYVGENFLPSVYVSYPSLTTSLDLRDDPIEPHRGVFVSNTVQIAGYVFGGNASDVREQPEIRTYVPISKRVTFATRAAVGFVFAHNYGSTLCDPNDPACKTFLNTDTAAVDRDEQLLLFRALYSGGPNSNRGYPFRGVGPQGVLDYLEPAGSRCKGGLSPGEHPDVWTDDPSCFRPQGGLTLWEASAELRFPVSEPVLLALFVDASDVNRNVATFRFNVPHLSTGIGFRYATPIGPVRVDLGYRIPYMQEVGRKDLRPEDGSVTTIFGLPLNLQFGLGEAF